MSIKESRARDLHAQIEQKIRALHEQQRGLVADIQAEQRTAKPAFPTDEQRAGVREAARRIRLAEAPASHHGDPCLTYAVKVDGARGWLSIGHGAGLIFGGDGGRVWWFTEQDVDALLDLVRAAGLEPVYHWTHDTGVSIEVRHP